MQSNGSQLQDTGLEIFVSVSMNLMPILNSSYLTQYPSIFNSDWTADIRDYIYRTINPSAVMWGQSKCKVMAENGRTPAMQFFVLVIMGLMPTLNLSYLTQYLSIFNTGWTADIRNLIYRTIEPSAAAWGWSNCKAMAVNGRTLVMQIFVSVSMDLMPAVQLIISHSISVHF